MISHDQIDEVEMPALDWGGHNKMSHNTWLKSNRFIQVSLDKGAVLRKLVIQNKPLDFNLVW